MLQKDTVSGIVNITCDKCGYSQIAPEQYYNNDFFESGWALCPNAKKYIHRCRNCQTARERKAHDFVAEKFPPLPYFMTLD